MAVSPSIFAQNNQELQLANQYFQKGEYEKAAELYEKLYTKNARSTHYYRQYYKTLLAIKDFEKAEKLIRKQMKQRKTDVTLYVDMGMLYKNQELYDKADEEFDRALKTVEENQVRVLASTFSNSDEYDYAIETYKKGKTLLGDPKAYAYELALAYKKKGDFEEMIGCYLDYSVSAENSSKLQTVKNALQKMVTNDDNMEELQTQLYGRIQKEPQELVYPELLIWAFIQQKDFESAYVQVTAIDRRLGESGKRVMDLAQLSATEQEYDTAIDAYEYVIAKGANNPLYISARIDLLKCRKFKITDSNDYTNEDILNLQTAYHSFLEEFGKNPTTIATIRDLGHLYAYYINDLDQAINLLEEVMDMGSANSHIIGYCKLDLGDYYLMKNEIWEATLYYSQVDKAFKDDILGEEARFKNAKLSYYHGDFEWSQAQLNVLKASTSELIANDALELSVFITDNLGLDTTLTPMQMFASADLLILQNKINAATTTLDSINRLFPAHNLDDDIMFLRADLKMREKNYVEAVTLYETILSKYGTDILADDALFALAQINEKHLDNIAQAMEYYQTLLIDFPSSLYVVEARKRYRKLRGDVIN